MPARCWLRLSLTISLFSGALMLRRSASEMTPEYSKPPKLSKTSYAAEYELHEMRLSSPHNLSHRRADACRSTTHTDGICRYSCRVQGVRVLGPGRFHVVYCDASLCQPMNWINKCRIFPEPWQDIQQPTTDLISQVQCLIRQPGSLHAPRIPLSSPPSTSLHKKLGCMASIPRNA